MNTLSDLIQICNSEFGFDITSKKKDTETYVFGRTVYYLMAQKYFKNKRKSEIGTAVNKNHAGFIYGIKKYEETYKGDPTIEDMINRVECVILELDPSITLIARNKNYLDQIKDLNKEVIQLRVEINKIKSKNPFAKIPEELREKFIETRLEPFLKMNKVS